jgi:adenosylhomocysteine nucleosidase
MAILFVASEGFELKPLAARLTGLRTLKWPLDYAEEGVWHGKRYLLTANGAGPKLAARCLEVAQRSTSMAELSASKLEAVISTGLCGALDPTLVVGDIVQATQVLALDDATEFSSLPLQASQTARQGVVVSTDHVAGTVVEKTKLAGLGALAVEMEAAGLARRAIAVQLPFCCIKVVSDRSDEEFVMDFNQLRSTEGRFSRGKIIVHALTHPISIPRLLALRRQSQEAASALGVFLAGCRFDFSDPSAETE